MMIEPRPEVLLRRICESLAQTVLTELPSGGVPHRQLKAALFALGHVAGQLEGRATRLADDVRDMEQLLGDIGVAGEPDVEAHHLALQARLLSLAESAVADPQAARHLREVFLGMLQREAGSRSVKNP